MRNESETKIPVYKIKLPEYTEEKKPDYNSIGRKIDTIIKKHFLNRKVAIRCISSKEHNGKSTEEIIKILKKTGTDRYDRKIKGDRYDNQENKRIDFFALDFKVTEKSKMLNSFIKSFYEWPQNIDSKPIMVDLIMLYDRAQLRMVPHTYDGKRKKRDGFVFKNPKDKISALKGIIRIL